MSYTYFNPQSATDLAKFQGNLAGIQAGNSTVTGVAMAPTSIYNQAGYYALMDDTTGYVSLQKLADESLYTKQWYDQTTGTIFDFTPGGAGIQSTQSNSNSSVNSVSSNGLIEYPNGAGYVLPDVQTFSSGVQTTTASSNSSSNSSNVIVDEEGNPVTLTASDIKQLVDAGIYENNQEALFATLYQGYTVDDNEQAKLGIYSSDDENKIKLMMDKYNYSREEAIYALGYKIETKDTEDVVAAKFNNLLECGFSRKEATEYLLSLGAEVPEELTKEPVSYKKRDEEKIEALQASTGCSRDEAILALGAKPDSNGILRSLGKGVDNFFSGIGNGLSQAWQDFTDWLW